MISYCTTKTKILFATLTLVVGITFLFLPIHKASATLPTVDAGNIVQSTLNAVFDGMSYGEEIMNSIKEFGGDEAAYLVAQALQENLVGNITEWANSGGENGNPLYITNQKSFLSEIKDVELLRLFADVDASNSSTSGSGGGNSLSTFSSTSSSCPSGQVWDDVVNSCVLGTATADGNNPGGSSCPSGQVWDDVVNSCVLGTATADGNNPGGGSSTTTDSTFDNLNAADKRVLAKIVEAEKKPLDDKLAPTMTETEQENFSNDFTKGGWGAWTKLGKPVNNPIGRERIIKTEYAKRLQEAEKAAEQEALQNSGFNSQKDCVAQRENSTGGDFNMSQYGINIQQTSTAQTDPDCEREETTTPGSTNQGMLTQALGSSGEQLQQIDELMEIASNALSQLTSSLIGQGLAKISGGTSGGNQSIGGLIQWQGASDGITMTPQNNIISDWQNAPTIVVNLEIELAEAIKNTGTAVAYLERTLDEQENYLINVMDLDYLKPGPDRNWIERLRSYHQEKQEDSVSKEDDRLFAEAVSRQQELLDSTLHIPNMSTFDYQSTNSFINNLPNVGRTAVQTRDQLAQFRSVLRRLYSVRDAIIAEMGLPNQGVGTYDFATNTWNQNWPGSSQWIAWETETPEQVQNQYRTLFNQLRTDIPQNSALTRIQGTYESVADGSVELERLVGVWENYWNTYYTFQPNMSGLISALDPLRSLLQTLQQNDPLFPDEGEEILELIDQFDYTEIPSNSSVVLQLRQEETQRAVAREIQSKITNALPIPSNVMNGISQFNNALSTTIFGLGGTTTPQNLLNLDRANKLYCGFAEKPWNKLTSGPGLQCSPDQIKDNWYRANKYDYRKIFHPELP